MTYFGFLIRFLILPLLILVGLHIYNARRQHTLPRAWQGTPLWATLATLIVIAILYTTPWDNYMIARGVWWYDPALVAGITIGWVPIEEYTFFILQPIFTGVWLLFWNRRLSVDAPPLDQATTSRWVSRRWWVSLAMGMLWLLSVAMAVIGWQPGTYLALELAWALPPIILQLAVGADILWQARRPILVTILTITSYLGFCDALAIDDGTWIIDPAQSLNLLLGGILPIEELIFFLLTNTLIVFGITLMLSPQCWQRLPMIGISDRYMKSSLR